MIAVIDYGSGNIGSVLNMLKKVGGAAFPTRAADDIIKARKVILPGVGSFDNAMQRLSDLGLVAALKSSAASGTPFLGICLGMQLLADASDEGQFAGLGLIPGKVKRFSFEDKDAHLKVPHMGWNKARPSQDHPLAQGLQEARFYFVHSYYFVPQQASDSLFVSNYGHDFTSGVRSNNVMGVQFHPEKSHRFGMQLLRNFVEL